MQKKNNINSIIHNNETYNDFPKIGMDDKENNKNQDFYAILGYFNP